MKCSFALSPLFALLIVACEGGVAVSLNENATADSLVFLLEGRRRTDDALRLVNLIAVRVCSEQGHAQRWLIERREGMAPIPTSLRYGVTPEGWAATYAPAALAAGCYELLISGAKGVRGGALFHVDSAAAVSMSGRTQGPQVKK